MSRVHKMITGKQRIAFFLAILLVISTLAPYAQAADYPYTSLTNDKVNMRRSASSSSIVLERLEVNTEVTVLGESGKYFKVSYNNRTGYILKEYIGSGTAAPTATATATATATVKPSSSSAGTVTGFPYQTTTRDKVNMRRSPSSSSVVLERLPAGAELTVEGESGKYLKVRYDGTSGYVMAEFVYVRTVSAGTATPAPAPISDVNNAYTFLGRGSSGKEVKALQQVLKELKYLSGTLDGEYGSQTETAVKNCQKKNGLAETGAADQALQTLLYEKKPVNADGKSVKVMTLPPLDGVTIREGNTGDAVEKLQLRLTELRYYDGPISGVCSSETISAVKAFQKKSGLTSDGLAGSATLTKLYSQEALEKDAAATPTPAPIASAPGVTVRQGDEGEAAKTVQNRLKELGYLSGSVDGKFGTVSVAALKAFQKRHGLDQDGVAGSATQTLLFSSAALPAAGEATPVPTSTPLTPENVIVMQRGTRGVQVLNLQKRLTELGYYTAKMDSDYQAADIAAVKAFQKNNGLKADGIAGYETQVLLFSDKAVPGASFSPTPTPTPAPTPDLSTLRQGDTGNQVKALQQRLYQLGYLSAQSDGKFGSGTAMAVMAFQKANSLNQDGVAGPSTLGKLYSPEAVPKPTATPSPTPTFLRQGDSSDAVKAMQMTLIDLGYLSGKADGVFGAQTFLALKAFQSNNSLPSDGVAGEKTLNILGSSTAKPAPTVPGATATPKPTAPVLNTVPKASQVRYANWYTEIRARCRTYPYATIYDYNTGLSWKVHMFSLGAHADAEPVSATDTAIMVQAFGGKYVWTPKPVWVVMGDGRVYMATTHDTPHGVDHNTTNNFPGHLCIHFPRTQAEVAAIGNYATTHQKAVDLGWQATQKMIK